MNARTEPELLHHLSNSHLDALEEETIFILREVAAAFERPALLFSGGKDSLVMLKCAEKAFVDQQKGGHIPYPLLMIDTGHNFKEVTDFRDFRANELGAELVVRSVEDSMKRGTVRLAHLGESRNVHQSVTALANGNLNHNGQNCGLCSTPNCNRANIFVCSPFPIGQNSMCGNTLRAKTLHCLLSTTRTNGKWLIAEVYWCP